MLDPPQLTSGQYLVSIDAAGEPGCSAVTYDIELRRLPFTGAGPNQNISTAGCSAAKSQVATDREMVARSRAGTRSKNAGTRARYKSYLAAWSSKLARDIPLAKRACKRGR